MKILACVFVWLLVALPARAQDFEVPSAGARQESAAGLLEYGLPSARAGWSLGGFSVSRHAIPELTTRAIAMAAGWKMLRTAVGLSQTGDPEIGWTSLAAGLGFAGSQAGFGVRAATRRDRWWLAEPTPLGAGTGAEAGVAAWMRPTPRVDLWASAPHVWLRGSPPPLERGLHMGARVQGAQFSVWLEQEMRAPGAAPAAVHGAGVGLAAGTSFLWASVRDAPLRATVGVSSGLSWLGVAAEAESHPVLGETLRLAVQVRSGSVAGR